MNIARVGQSFALLFVLLSTGCALEASEPEPADDLVASESAPFIGHGERRSGGKCAPVIAKDAGGNLFVKELWCPLPERPLPDPEATTFMNRHEDWVERGESSENSVY